ncbi:HORMA domain-containing protein [Mycena epipterygia]|nr:HORMA domain-containing protein [Mycena epipterygia]
MQAQGTRAEVATTSAQSLVAIQTLLKASLGCITFLRLVLFLSFFTFVLLSHFTTSDSDDTLLSSDSSRSIDSTCSNSRNVNGFKIMVLQPSLIPRTIFNRRRQTMTRGYTDEADKILNYLEYGIFDALQRGYLRSFVFAIYLAYTFNFQYHTIPGTDTVIPIMSLGENLDKMSLRESAKDPVVQAAKKGKPPTLKDVKKSVKTLLKTLIHSTTQMDVLPKRRFAAFKLFYTDETPAEYEPPHFQAGDAQKDKWFFMTHDLDEVPDKWSMGQLKTGHHSVNLSVASIATYLPSSTENDHATFTGTTTRVAAPPTLTPVEEATIRAEQAAKQSKDAESRNIVWSADASDELDAEGEDDPDYVRIADGSFVPVGVRNEAGVIEPLPASMDIEEAQFGGVSQTVPTRLYDVNAQQKFDNTDLEQTQTFPNFPDPSQDSRPPSRGHSPSTSSGHGHGEDLFDPSASLPPSDLMSPLTSGDEGDIDTQMLQNLMLDNQAMTEDSEMLDMETQVNPGESVDPIQSFGDSAMEDQIEDMPTPKPLKKAGKEKAVDHGLRCECDVAIEDDTCFCEGGCGRWYHLCFHSTDDRRIPEEFICFDCRVRADLSWELIKVDLYPKMLSKFKDLALFRRAIKVAETNNPETVASCDNVLARQLFKRLENEGFIVEQSMEINDLGFAQAALKTRGKSKTKGKQPKQRKNVQKSKYVFNRSSLTTTEYSDYFNPDHRVESRLLDLPQTKANVKSRPNAPATADTSDVPAMHSLPPMETLPQETQTQTQEDTQPIDTPPADIPPAPLHNKRPLSNDGARPKKKVKISMAPAVDLAE